LAFSKKYKRESNMTDLETLSAWRQILKDKIVALKIFLFYLLLKNFMIISQPLKDTRGGEWWGRSQILNVCIISWNSNAMGMKGTCVSLATYCTHVLKNQFF
jgi:hypothetical protein